MSTIAKVLVLLEMTLIGEQYVRIHSLTSCKAIGKVFIFTFFRNVIPEVIFDFLREIGMFYKI